ncbi:MAG TPA: hypothetical protein VGU23_08730 [Acidobacteriaceae bacterium]|nr:hypothetical protein [Acidobacteriaceae bacterium]
MRKVLLSLFLASALCASAQQAAQPAGKGWDAVRALHPGSSLDIKLRQGGQKCNFRSADADTLTCNHGTDITLQRADILQVKAHQRARSTLAGLAIGAGAGAGIGAAATTPCSSNSFCFGGRAGGALVYGVLGGAAGALTGYFSDFTHSTIYKAP